MMLVRRSARSGLPNAWLPRTLALTLALAVAACAADRQAGLPANAPLPPAAPRVSGLDRIINREHSRLVAAFGGEYRAPAAQRELEEIVAKLVPASDQPSQNYRVTILNSPVVNAFALPTGNIYVTRGLLTLASDPSEVAAVMAHEIAHVTANHALARAELEQRSLLVSRVVADVLNDPAAGQLVRAESRLSLAGFSRAQELEADRIGVRTIAKAGYDPFGAARFLAALDRNGGLKAGASGSKRGMDFASSHPSTPERVAQAMREARQFGRAPASEGRAAYLAAIDGMIYGEDPAEGYVRGRYFAHPGLAIAFTAPEGFALENTAQAVLGLASGGAQALRFDGVQVPQDQSLEQFLASGWIEGLDTASVRGFTINGLPAAEAVARGQEWIFHLGAVRVDGTVYRLLYATRTETPAAESAFRQTLDSIRRLSPDDIRAIKPLRVRLVMAQPGDTTQTMAARMATADHSLERFLVLNGLTHSGPLKAGETYKIVTE